MDPRVVAAQPEDRPAARPRPDGPDGHDGEAEARTAPFPVPGLVHPVEALKEVGEVLLGDPLPVVLHPDHRLVP